MPLTIIDCRVADTISITARPTRPGPDLEALPSELSDWPAEQLWLSDGYWLRSVQQSMADAVSSATDAVLSASDRVVPDHELLLVLSWTRKRAAAMRLSARLLRGSPGHATPRAGDLTATALLLAAVRHGDLLAALELSAEVANRGKALEAATPADMAWLPPGVRSSAELAARMRQRAHEVLTVRLNSPEPDMVASLEQAIADDPLRRPDPAPGELPPPSAEPSTPWRRGLARARP